MHVIKVYINSGDNTFVNGAQVLVAQWAEVGIKVEVQTVLSPVIYFTSH